MELSSRTRHEDCNPTRFPFAIMPFLNNTGYLSRMSTSGICCTNPTTRCSCLGLLVVQFEQARNTNSTLALQRRLKLVTIPSARPREVKRCIASFGQSSTVLFWRGWDQTPFFTSECGGMTSFQVFFRTCSFPSLFFPTISVPFQPSIRSLFHTPSFQHVATQSSTVRMKRREDMPTARVFYPRLC